MFWVKSVNIEPHTLLPLCDRGVKKLWVYPWLRWLVTIFQIQIRHLNKSSPLSSVTHDRRFTQSGKTAWKSSNVSSSQRSVIAWWTDWAPLTGNLWTFPSRSQRAESHMGSDLASTVGVQRVQVFDGQIRPLPFCHWDNGNYPCAQEKWPLDGDAEISVSPWQTPGESQRWNNLEWMFGLMANYLKLLISLRWRRWRSLFSSHEIPLSVLGEPYLWMAQILIQIRLRT
jgi:hypothetical protein